MTQSLATAEYRCPGENYSISRAVHLARLADVYPGCFDCPCRHDTAGLSARQVRRLAEIDTRRQNRPWFGVEGMRDVPINEVSVPAARMIAIEFARRLWDDAADARPTLVFAGDGRLSTTTIVAAVVEGIRWTGCETVDLGPASAPCMAQAIERLEADGGIYLGNPGGAAHTLGMKFWAHGELLSDGPLFDAIAAAIEAHAVGPAIDRPARAFGPLRRVAAADNYLSDLRPAYHALRPLRFVLHSTCEPVLSYLEDLMQNVACRATAADPASRIGEQVAAAGAHFGIEITDDGQNARVFDERGAAVATERLLASLAGEIGEACTVTADALRTLTLLLVLLSRDDLPLSTVLDRAAVKK